MLKETLDKLIGDPKVYYIYNLGFPIWGLEGKNEYLIIVDPTWSKPDDVDGTIINTNEWFKKVMNGELSPWICACLDKKFVLKEHVKLLMTTNPLQLRKCFDLFKTNTLNNLSESIDDVKIQLWTIIRNAKLANQIIENHKIVNFKNSVNEYMELDKNKDFDSLISQFSILLAPELDLLYRSTDGLLHTEKMKKWQQKIKS